VNKQERKCPQCSKTLTYSSIKTRNRAEKQNKWCVKCRSKEVNSRIGIGKYRLANRRSYRGADNPFFDRKHHSVSKLLMSANRDNEKYHTEEFRKKISLATSGEKNPMYGRSYVDVWRDRYGIELANSMLEKHRDILSKAMAGENNPMWGRSPSHKAGAGWSGWYDGWFFRSLRELSYVIRILEPSNIEWKSGETISIPYVSNGHSRTYRPDFLVNDKVIEIKPLAMQSLPINVCKFSAARDWCTKLNLEFVVCDVRVLTLEELRVLDVVFTAATLRRIEKWKKQK
jgi:hypothetical protein